MEGYFLTAPGMNPIPITKEVYLAMYGFLMTEGDKPCGNVTVDFRSGSIAAVASVTKKVYK